MRRIICIVVRRNDVASKSIISGEGFFFFIAKKKRRRKRGKTDAGKHGECGSLQKRTSASEIKRFMVVSGALSLGPTAYHGALTPHPFPSSVSSLSLLLSSLPRFLALCAPRLSRLNPRLSYFAAKIVECAFQLKGGGSSRGFTCEQNARCQNKSRSVQPLRSLPERLARSAHVIIARTPRRSNFARRIK